MRHIKYILVIVAMLILSAVPALAVEGLEASVSGGLEFFSGDVNNAKFNEYRVRREGPWGGYAAVDAYYAKPDGNHEYNLHLNYRSLEDIDFCFDTMSYGEYKFFVNYQRMGHDFATNVKTLYSGDGSGRLTVPINARNTIGAAVVPATLISLIKDAHTIDLFLIRDRVKTGLEWMSLKPLTFYALFDYEHREGDRPYGGGFGFTAPGSIEIPEPIDYDTYNTKAGVEFAGKPIYADVRYDHSTFNNNIQSVTFDNILATTVSPTRGRASLPPSNSFDSVSVVLAKNLPLATRVVFDFNYGWLRQDEHLLSPTINPAVVLAAAMPRGSADTAVDTMTYDVKLASSPIDKLELKAGFRYYQHDNRTSSAAFPTSVSDSADNGTEVPEYMSWITRTANAEASYEVYRRTRVGFSYEYMHEDLTKGSARSESENTYKLFMDSRALDYLTARLTLKYAKRDSRYPDEDPANNSPELRKYYQASRERFVADTLVTVMPMDSLSVSLDYSYDDTRYMDSVFGLHDGRGHVASIDTVYQPAWWLGMNIFYTYENQRSRQNEHRSDANWFLKTIDETNTVGGGVDVGIIKDRLNFKVDGSYAKVDGDAFFDRKVALVPALPALLPWDKVDETMLTKIGATFKYKATKALELSLGYGYEKWDIQDYQQVGRTEVVVTGPPVTYRNLLTMNSLYKPYEVHTVFAGATYKF